jgi:hypothetical protein
MNLRRAIQAVLLMLLLAFPDGSGVNALAETRAATGQPLETLTVDVAKSTVTQGTVDLKAGTRYQLQVSGTFTITGPSGGGFDYDALYCDGDFGFLPGTPPQCQPPSQNANFYVGAGTSSLQEIDHYQTPQGTGIQLGYNPGHTYITDFYPPADGKLTAGGSDAFTHCKTDPTPCQDAISGTITIMIFGPSGGAGGGSLAPPTTFCPTTASSATPPTPEPCVVTRYVEPAVKSQARDDLRVQLEAAVNVCGNVLVNKKHAVDLGRLCVAVVDLMAHTLTIIHDPPDPSFRSVTLPRSERPAAVASAVTNYASVVSAEAGAAQALAIGANRFAGAVKANNPEYAFLQEAFGKVNAGAVAIDLIVEQRAGKVLAKQLNLRFSARQVKQIEPKIASREVSNQTLNVLISDGLAKNRNAARSLLAAQLESFSGSVTTSALGALLPSSALMRRYKSITMSELDAVVNGLQGDGLVSTATAQALTNDLVNAQDACANRTQRAAAIRQFIADAHARVASPPAAQFLTLGAQPLTASNLPTSSCR